MVAIPKYQIISFAIVGITVAASYILLYVIFIRTGLSPFIANALAFFLAIIIQYIGQAFFTFKKPLKSSPQVFRFACIIGSGFFISTIITNFIGPAFAWPNLFSAILVTILLPIHNFLFFKAWVFSSKDTSSEI